MSTAATTKHQEVYYLYEEETRTIFHTDDEEKTESLQSMIFLGSSINPNKRHAVSVFTKQMKVPFGFKIKELP